MKVRKQEDSGLRKIQPGLEKANLHARIMSEVIREGNGGIASREEGEEDTRKQLAPWERRAWDKISPRRKRHFLRYGKRAGGAAGSTEAVPGTNAGIWESKAAGSKVIMDRRAGIRASRGMVQGTPAGWQRADREEPVFQDGKAVGCSRNARTSSLEAGEKRWEEPATAGRASNAGKTATTGRVPNSGRTAATGMTAAATGAAGGAAAVAAAKKAAGRFRMALAGAQMAGEKAEDELQDVVSAHLDTARSSDTLGGKVVNLAAAAAVYLAAKMVAAAAAAITTLLTLIASFLPMVLIVALVAMLLVSLIPLFTESVTIRSQAIVDVARQELEHSDENIGGIKYKDWYGLHDQWCAMFVTWCADQCGYIESGIVPKTASVAELHSWFEAKGQYHDKAGYIPKAGDIIIFEGPGSSHTGIVVSYDAATYVVTTIEGNVQGHGDHTKSRVASYTYPISAMSITGFCAPDYPATIGQLSGDTNAERVYRAFVDAGYTPEASAAVCGNLAGEGGTDASDDLVLDGTESGGTGEGIGICQWSFGRKTEFLAYAASKGEPWPETGLAVQLEFMMKELTGNQWLWTNIGAEYGSQYNISHEQFKTCRDVDFATTAFCANFERCHEYNSNMRDRKKYARRVLDSFGSYQAGSGGNTETE